MEGSRICVKCRIEKSVKDFVVDTYLKGGRTRDCKTCRAERFREPNKLWKADNPEALKCYKEANRGTKGWEYRIKYTYGLSPQEYDKQFITQEGICAICPNEIEVVDHNHTTGKLRGLLCQRCKRGLGHFDDDPLRIRKALEYLDVDGVWGKG